MSYSKVMADKQSFSERSFSETVFFLVCPLGKRTLYLLQLLCKAVLINMRVKTVTSF